MRQLEISLCDAWLATQESDPPPPKGISVEYQTRESAWSGAVALIVRVAAGVSLGILANWLYDHLVKHGAKRITIDRQEVIVNRGEVQRIIREKIEIRQ